MRVIAGRARGMKLKIPRGQWVRPTADRVKEALFSILGSRVDGARVLDLFAGSGALGIEALSRGAELAVFVDIHRHCLATIRENLQRARLEDQAILVAGDVRRVLPRLAAEGHRFDVIFMDPPYGQGLAAAVLELVDRTGLLAPGGLVVVETGSREEIPTDLENVGAVRTRIYGDTQLIFLEGKDAQSQGGGES